MSFDVNQIISYRDMCNAEEQEQLQRGMNFQIGGSYSVVLMSSEAEWHRMQTGFLQMAFELLV